MQTSNLISCTPEAVPDFFFKSYYAINYIYLYNYAQIRCIVFMTKSKPLLPRSAKDNAWERNQPPGDQIKTLGTPKSQHIQGW